MEHGYKVYIQTTPSNKIGFTQIMGIHFFGTISLLLEFLRRGNYSTKLVFALRGRKLRALDSKQDYLSVKLLEDMSLKKLSDG